MPSRLIAALILGFLPLSLQAASATITADQWATPRSGERVARLPGLREVIASFDSASQRIVIHYAAGEAGTLWAEELRSWLVALGVPSAVISLNPGLARRDIVRVEAEPK